MRTLSTITVFPSSEAELTHYITTLKGEILSGGDDPLNVLKQLKFAEKSIAAILKDPDIEDHFLSEALKYEKSFEHLGVKFTVQETGTKYAYNMCRDSVWNDLDNQRILLDAKLKARETFLKALSEEGAANPETGEIILQPLKTSTTKLVVRL
jgi:hypothetical protein